jgi:type I restriction enzyme R subunit
LPTPEEEARILIDNLLEAAGWQVQDRQEMNLHADVGVAVREFYLDTGEADYLLFVNRKAVGVVEAKPFGTTLSGVAEQSGAYAAGLPVKIPHYGEEKLPFIYQSTGIETQFRDERDPAPRSRRVFAFHKAETLAAWAEADDSLRRRVQYLPPLITAGLWKAQIEAIENLERSLAENRPRALIQMATGSGKTYTTVSFVYRLIKFVKARRVLFLVDRNNLGRQAFKEFDQYITPDDGRKFTELYNVQHLRSNVLDPVSKVQITTIQRLYSMLSGELEFDPENEEQSLFTMGSSLDDQAVKEVMYSPEIPIEYYDFIITDECHRSIYNLWRQVLEYFDAFLIGLTATPSKQTFGFFNQNLVMEYPRQRAVADGVNVDGEVYRIRTHLTQYGGEVDAGFWVGRRDRSTRQVRWEELEEDLAYDPNQLDRDVVAKDQIRTVIRTYRDKLFTEIFPEREEVPKTLIFAKSDSHAEDIVEIVREEFGKGDDFCQKITYKVSGRRPEDLISDFRISYNPRIAVTVDMIATGTDIRPLEVLLFMRAVKSRVLFEQMLGRGTRIVTPTELQGVTPDASYKDHFVIIDAVGVVEQDLVDTQTLERKRSKTFKQLLEIVALGAADEDDLSSLAGRLARLDRKLNTEERAEVVALSDGMRVSDLVNGLLDALDPDIQLEAAKCDLPMDIHPTPEHIKQISEKLAEEAVIPLASNPALRNLLLTAHERSEQTIDEVSQDQVLEAGFLEMDSDKARVTVESFRRFIEENKDEITALQIIYSRPYGEQRLTFHQVKELASLLEQPPRSWTTEVLWRAYAQLEKDKVRGVGGKRVLTDLVSLVRHAIELEDELIPYPDVIRARYQEWLVAQETTGKKFSEEQRWWLDRIVEHIGINLRMSIEDLNYGEFFNRGGQVAAVKLFGIELQTLIENMNSDIVR